MSYFTEWAAQEKCHNSLKLYWSSQGEIKTSYQKRWFVLKGNLLFYKDRPTDRDLTGLIVLEGCTVQLCESEEQFAFSLVWAEPGLRTYKFAAEDQPSQESWIKALLSANHNYMSLLVMDLEKKYKGGMLKGRVSFLFLGGGELTLFLESSSTRRWISDYSYHTHHGSLHAKNSQLETCFTLSCVVKTNGTVTSSWHLAETTQARSMDSVRVMVCVVRALYDFNVIDLGVPSCK